MTSVELRFPGKYDEHGRRAPLPGPTRPLRIHERHPQVAPIAPRPADRLVAADNLELLAWLGAHEPGSVDLAVIDPPFCTGGSFEASVAIGEGTKARTWRAPAYDDRFAGGTAGFLQMLDPRLRLVHRVLAAHGSLYVHLDATLVHAVKLLLDEIFGAGGFQREIVWRIGWVSGFKTRARNWIRNHDVILYYVKDPRRFTFNKQYVPRLPGYRRRDGAPGRAPGLALDDVWNANAAEQRLAGAESLDSIQIKSFSGEKTGFETQKNLSLLRRIVAASSNPGDLVADFFCGSGTTLVAAAQLERRFLGCDASPTAVRIARRRLLELPGRAALELGELGDADAGASEARVELEPDGRALAVRLAGYRRDPSTVPPELRSRIRSWADLVDGWMVDWEAGAGPMEVDDVAFRSGKERRLPRVLGPRAYAPGSRTELVVRVLDVMGGRADVRVPVAVDRRGRMRVG